MGNIQSIINRLGAANNLKLTKGGRDGYKQIKT
jgi:hypothetical protein